MKIIFYGTPEIAVQSLDELIRNNFDVQAVVTSPDRPAGRGLKLRKPEVKIYAEEKGLLLFQPESLEDPGFINEIKALNPDLQIVVAFRKLPEAIWSLPKYGTFNLHASLLPQYRGAAPINWAIIHGEKVTGVTTFFISHKIDKGDIIMQERVAVEENETAGSLHDKLSLIGAKLVVRTVEAIRLGNYTKIQQPPEQELRKAPKIYTEDCRIDFQQTPKKIYNFIRGLSPHPGAWAIWDKRTFKILKAELVQQEHDMPVCQIKTDYKTFLWIALKEGYLSLLEVQPEGKRIMGIKDFLNGLNKEVTHTIE